MKQLFFSLIVVLTTFACSKQEQICDRAICTYTLPSYTDCTPNGGENGWSWDSVRIVTVVDTIPGECPEAVEKQFNEQLNRTYHLPTTGEAYRKFADVYPATCGCK